LIDFLVEINGKFRTLIEESYSILFDSRERYSSLEEKQIKLGMELFTRNSNVSRFPIKNRRATAAYLG
jgi:hypothetical protein